jgi:hypothetical protein
MTRRRRRNGDDHFMYGVCCALVKKEKKEKKDKRENKNKTKQKTSPIGGQRCVYTCLCGLAISGGCGNESEIVPACALRLVRPPARGVQGLCS